jgi:nuclear transport factor 2 (NTF2) superfamily protein
LNCLYFLPSFSRLTLKICAMPALDPVHVELAQTILKNAYTAFNHRDMDTAISLMHPDVDWPNGMEGGTEHGHEAVRKYWTRQWKLIDPYVDPIEFNEMADGRIDVTVHQVIKDLSGIILADLIVHHIYKIEDGLIINMEIEK